MLAQFNVLWLDPTNPDAFPDGLVEAIVETAADAEWDGSGSQGSKEGRLRAQMQADALGPLGDDDEDLPREVDTSVTRTSLPPRTIEDAAQFLRLDVSSYIFIYPPLPFHGTPNQPSRSSFLSLIDVD